MKARTLLLAACAVPLTVWFANAQGVGKKSEGCYVNGNPVPCEAGSTSSSSTSGRTSNSGSGQPTEADVNQHASYVLIQQALKAMRRKNYLSAINLLLQAPMGTPNDSAVRWNLAAAWVEWGREAYDNRDWTTALQRFTEAAKYNVTEPWVTENLKAAQEQYDYYERLRQKLQARARTVDEIRSGLRQMASTQPDTPPGAELQFIQKSNATSELRLGGSDGALQQAYSAEGNGNLAASLQQPSFSKSGIKQWDTSADERSGNGFINGQLRSQQSNRQIPLALKANPQAWAKYQQMQSYQQQLEKEYRELDEKLHAIRQMQSTGQAEAGKLAVQGAQIKDQLTAKSSQIQSALIDISDFTLSFEGVTSHDSNTPAQAKPTRTGPRELRRKRPL